MPKPCPPACLTVIAGWYCVRAILWAYDFTLPASVTAHAGATFTADGVPMHVGATLLFPGGRRGHFECGFDRIFTQTLEVAGTLGTLRCDDFVLPRSPDKCSFVMTHKHSLTPVDYYDVTQRDEVTVTTPKRQVRPRSFVCNACMFVQEISWQPNLYLAAYCLYVCFMQETLMWECFCADVQRLRAGGGGEPNAFWPRIAALTQRVLFAVDLSAREGCREVRFDS